MKKQLLLILMSLLPMVASANDIEVKNADGITIYYNYIHDGNGGLEVTFHNNYQYYHYSNDLVIPEEVTYMNKTHKVRSIGAHAFDSSRDLTSVTIPNSVTTIGESAFASCISLTSVTIPNSVTKIGKSAFQKSGLTSIIIPNSVTSTGESAFAGCSSLTSVTIPNSVTHISDNTFRECRNLTSVTIPNSVSSIGEYAFQSCSGLTSITIGNGMKIIDREAFSDCNGLKKVIITDLEKWFYISFNDERSNPLTYAHHLYLNDEEVKDLIIPNSVTTIEDYAFCYCTALSSVTIPNNVIIIENEAFAGCSSLTSVTIPNSVTKIYDYAFVDCSNLKSISIGSGIEMIGPYAFGSCPELTDVYCYAKSVPSTNADAFKDSYIELATLYVPDASVNAYRVNPWSRFKKILGLSGTIPQTQKCATPTISYGGKKLSFSCTTEGVEYVYEIKDSDIKKGYDSEIQLTATYEISVYATKAGYDNSDVATATLVWGSASFTETTGTTSARPLTIDTPILIQSNGGVLTIQGADEGTQVNVYSINGTQAGSAISQSGAATINTNLQPGSVAIVKVGEKSVKVVVK